MTLAFRDWFESLSGENYTPAAWREEPCAWQERLAGLSECPTRLIRIPTGFGKTLGVLGAWTWHRIARNDGRWPRRLIWCLPMRVLVEQTYDVVRGALDRAGVLWDGTGDHEGKVGAHLLMGGAAADSDWTLYPEERAVFVGTQDMLLSRALNRGYAAPPARWPLEFGLLSHDALWVMDEVQLMDDGLATSAQLQAYFEADEAKGFRARRTWWMSATLQPGWLESVDTVGHQDAWVTDSIEIPADRRVQGPGALDKALTLDTIPAKDSAKFARYVAEQHDRLDDGEYGRITLVVCNTVDRACATFDALQKQRAAATIELVHGRFRPHERAAWRQRFLDRKACRTGVNRIIVATQVVEAGVDISAGCLVTELAPWPSLVQRFGRCARYGGRGQVCVVDRGRDDGSALPYAEDALEAALHAIEAIDHQGGGVGTAALDVFEESLDPESRIRLFPYEPKHLLLRRELDELFDTTPDLTGAHLDVGRFIRSGDERDVQVFWLDVAKPTKTSRGGPPNRRPRREELCSVPFLRARDWLCGVEGTGRRQPRLRKGMRAWVWDWIDGEWKVADRSMIVPGRVVCVAAHCGGYDVTRGFDPESNDVVPVVNSPPVPVAVQREIEADDAEDGEDLSIADWKTLACHAGEAAEFARRITTALGLDIRLGEVIVLAARWHDLGKVHPAFQGAIRHASRPQRPDLAKAPDDAWLPPRHRWPPGFRHELASALALFAVLERCRPGHPALLGPWVEALQKMGATGSEPQPTAEPTELERSVIQCSADEFDLIAYLVVSHHGKVRVALHASPKDQQYRVTDDRGLPIRGVREGDLLPSVVLETGKPALPVLSLTLEPASLGLSRRTGRSWRERTLDLQKRYGPGALAWLEGIVIAADRRASRLRTVDPVLAATTHGGPA